MSSMLSRFDIPKLPILGDHDSRHIQARIAEEAGAVAVMALERVPADIRAQGGVARMSDPKMIKDIMATVTIPVMAKARIGHFVECQVQLQLSFPPTFMY
jgi:pyridoxal biosynthesis lyase PdxS